MSDAQRIADLERALETAQKWYVRIRDEVEECRLKHPTAHATRERVRELEEEKEAEIDRLNALIQEQAERIKGLEDEVESLQRGEEL